MNLAEQTKWDEAKKACFEAIQQSDDFNVIIKPVAMAIIEDHFKLMIRSVSAIAINKMILDNDT